MHRSTQPGRVVLFPDADCGFCMNSTQTLQGNIFRAAVDIQSLQTARLSDWHLDRAECERLLHAVTPEGRITAGAGAVAAALRVSRFPWPIVARIMLLPGIRIVAEWVYALVATNRHRLPGGTTACNLDS